ncbi:MAG: hypothetical protein DCC54_12015 [Anaerolineae bacterium]|nr:MAG: hypothetical protein DCC54_12015 [Anaerolineae bacterium]
MTHVHFIGIGGSGISAIARLLLEMGYTVSGSDRVLSPFAGKLQADGATVFLGHDARNVSGADWVVRSSAIGDDNPEVREARARGIPVYKRAEFLGQLMEDKIGIAVAGAHGKTTTTAMIAWTLFALGRDPSFIVGSDQRARRARQSLRHRSGRVRPHVPRFETVLRRGHQHRTRPSRLLPDLRGYVRGLRAIR